MRLAPVWKKPPRSVQVLALKRFSRTFMAAKLAGAGLTAMNSVDVTFYPVQRKYL